MQYLLSEKELEELKGCKREVMRKLRTAVLDHLHNSVRVRTHIGGHDPFAREVCADSAQELAGIASKGQLGQMTAEQFNRLRGQLWCKWEPVIQAIDFMFDQAEKSL